MALKKTGFKNKPKKPLKRSGFKKPDPTIKKATKTAPRGKQKAKKVRVVPKQKRVKKLKTKLWTIFSRYIRKREADHTGWLTTSDGVWAHWKETDCGHLFHNSDRNSLLGGNELWFYENNMYPQSQAGNRFNKDDSAKVYTIWAIERYGMEEIKKMQELKRTYKLWTEEELQAKYEYYKAEFDKL